jgi:hypothetical protein
MTHTITAFFMLKFLTLSFLKRRLSWNAWHTIENRKIPFSL